MGILTGIAVATIRFDRNAQHLDDSLHQFTQLYRGARDQALLSGTSLRIHVSNNSLQLQQRQYGQWQNTDKPLPLPEELRWQFHPAPPIYLFPSGQSTPFRVQIFLPEDVHKPARVVHGDAMGRLSVGAISP